MCNVESIKNLSAREHIDYLREMIRAKMIEKGGDMRPQSIRMAADEIGVTQPTLSKFLAGTSNTMNAETCIRLARYLGVSPIVVLRLLGLNDVANALSELVSEPVIVNDPYVDQVAKAIEDLDPDSKAAVVKSACSVARILRENKNQYTVIGSNDETPKPKQHKAANKS